MSVTTQDLRPYVTHFSEEFKWKGEHTDVVKVGGVIKSIHEPIDQHVLLSFYRLVIDDHVGTLTVLVSSEMMKHYQDILKVGQTVLFEGYLNLIIRDVGGQKVRDYSVMAYDVQPLPVDSSVILKKS